MIVQPEPREDSRGFFARTWCAQEFEAHGLSARIAQCSISQNTRQGTLRGMHFQHPPYEEAKLVRCTRGAIYDVIVDLRKGSATFGEWIGVELEDRSRRALYIPAGFAHGFQTLADDTEVLYQISEFFHSEASGGFRWNDPAFGISWPLPNPILSRKDAAYPDYTRT